MQCSSHPLISQEDFEVNSRYSILVHDIFVVCPRWHDASADILVIGESLLVQIKVWRSPEHCPVCIRDLPSPSGPFKVPFVYRVVPPTSPTHTVGKAVPHHRFEENIGDSSRSLTSFQHSKFVKIGNHSGLSLFTPIIRDAWWHFPC